MAAEATRGPRRVAPWLPWTDGTGRHPRGWARLPLVAPCLGLYLAVSWALFLLLAEGRGGLYYAIDGERLRGFLFHIPALGRDPLAALVTLVTAPFLNHDSVQLVYVTILLLLFGIIFEAQEGPARTAAIFFGTTAAGALGAAALLHALYPAVLDTPLLANAWERTWSGGSAGCFGLLGALAARARRPWPLAALFILWEVNVAVWYLQNYTPAFHLLAFAAGFLAARYLIPSPRQTAAGVAATEAAAGGAAPGVSGRV
jgi:membrane associated rhomboid family serine protease